MNPPILKSVCEEEMQNASLDTNEVIVELKQKKGSNH